MELLGLISAKSHSMSFTATTIPNSNQQYTLSYSFKYNTDDFHIEQITLAGENGNEEGRSDHWVCILL